MPTHLHVADPAALTLPDAITDIDLLAPMPDPSMLLSQPLDLGLGLMDVTLPDVDSSQFLSASVERPRAEHELLEPFDELGLDITGELIPLEEGPSIEIGREAAPERHPSEEFALSPKALSEVDLGLAIGEEDITELPPGPEISLEGVDITMAGMEEPTVGEEPAVPPEARERSMSPLSELGEAEERALEQEVQETSLFRPAEEELEEEELIRQARAKRRKMIPLDTTTQLSTNEIRAQQNNRDRILKPASFLPRDPLLLALMNMQKTGGFVASILGDGRSQGWAPELRGIMSLEVISRPPKRKRAAGVAEEPAEAAPEAIPRLEFEEEVLPLEEAEVSLGEEITLGPEEEVLPSEAGIIPPEEEEEEVYSPVADHFDETTVPLLYPAESGVVSLETKHAVHLLRQVFGEAAETSEEERRKTAVSFQGLFPEASTTKSDAARMFNEILVLATKDAIKVEQPQPKGNEVGGPIKIRAKRGLWGSWAETDVSGAEAIKAAAARDPPPSSEPTATAAAPMPSAEVAVEA